MIAPITETVPNMSGKCRVSRCHLKNKVPQDPSGSYGNLLSLSVSSLSLSLSTERRAHSAASSRIGWLNSHGRLSQKYFPESRPNCVAVTLIGLSPNRRVMPPQNARDPGGSCTKNESSCLLAQKTCRRPQQSLTTLHEVLLKRLAKY